MEAFIARYRNITVLALAIFAQLLLLGYQLKNEKDVRLIRLWGVTAVTPVARVVHDGHGLVAGFWNGYVWLRGTRRQNEELRAELDRLKLENHSLRNALGAADRLKVLAAYQQTIPSETVVASVIGSGANPNSRVVFLDRGAGSGIKPGMAVITPDGIVGKVQAVFPGTSLVLLISDANSAAGVIFEKSRVHGIMKGTGLNEARIDYVPNEEKIAPGEKVYTSGEDRVYPKGLPVGVVSHAEPGRDFEQITLQPSARLNRLEEVLVVTKGVHQDLPDSLPRAQVPAELLPTPPPDSRGDLLGPAAPVVPRPEAYAPETDADKLKKRYREIGAMQGHIFGEGAPGSKPPDFNLGWTPPGAAAAQRPGPPANPATAHPTPTGAPKPPPGAVQTAPAQAPSTTRPAEPSAAAPAKPSNAGQR